MKRKKLIIFLCAALVLSLAATVLSLGLKEASDAREVQKLTERLEEADGHIPDDFTQEDMDKFLASADPEVIARKLKKINENVQVVPMHIIDGSKHTRPPTNTPFTSIQYDPETGEETVHVIGSPVQ